MPKFYVDPNLNFDNTAKKADILDLSKINYLCRNLLQKMKAESQDEYAGISEYEVLRLQNIKRNEEVCSFFVLFVSSR